MTVTRSKVELWQRALDLVGNTDKIESEDDISSPAEICRRHYDDIVQGILERLHWRFAIRQAPVSSIASQATTYTYDAAVSDTTFAIPHAFTSTDDVAVTKDGVSLTSGTDYNVLLGDAAAGTEDRVVLVVALTVGQSITITVSLSVEGYDYVYSLPADCITPVALLAEDDIAYLIPKNERASFDVRPRPGGELQMLCTNYLLDTDFVTLEYVGAVADIQNWPRLFVDAVVAQLEGVLWRSLAKDYRMAADAERRAFLALDRARVHGLAVRVPDPNPRSPSIVARGPVPRRVVRGISEM